MFITLGILTTTGDYLLGRRWGRLGLKIRRKESYTIALFREDPAVVKQSPNKVTP